MTSLKEQNTLEHRVQRFVKCNTRMREATLESERAFLELAGNISAAQLQILLAVGDNSPCTISQLAKILHFSLANVTQMVNRLIAKRFLKRTRSKEDGRVVYVSFLAKGEKIYQLNREHVERTARDWFSKMTNVEQEMMLNFLEKYLL